MSCCHPPRREEMPGQLYIGPARLWERQLSLYTRMWRQWEKEGLTNIRFRMVRRWSLRNSAVYSAYWEKRRKRRRQMFR